MCKRHSTSLHQRRAFTPEKYFDATNGAIAHGATINNYNLSMKTVKLFAVFHIMAHHGDLDCAELGNEQLIGVFYSFIMQRHLRIRNH